MEAKFSFADENDSELLFERENWDDYKLVSRRDAQGENEPRRAMKDGFEEDNRPQEIKPRKRQIIDDEKQWGKFTELKIDENDLKVGDKVHREARTYFENGKCVTGSLRSHSSVSVVSPSSTSTIHQTQEGVRRESQVNDRDERREFEPKNFRCIGTLITRFVRDDDIMHCAGTGTIIAYEGDYFYVLTAGHNLLDKEDATSKGYEADQVLFKSGDPDKPTIFLADRYEVHPCFEDHPYADGGFDIAVVRFPQKGDNAVEREESRIADVWMFVSSGMTEVDYILGYPFNKNGQLWGIANQSCQILPNVEVIRHKYDTGPGQSGSPMWNQKEGAIGAIHTGALHNEMNFGTVITENKLRWIAQFCGREVQKRNESKPYKVMKNRFCTEFYNDCYSCNLDFDPRRRMPKLLWCSHVMCLPCCKKRATRGIMKKQIKCYCEVVTEIPDGNFDGLENDRATLNKLPLGIKIKASPRTRLEVYWIKDRLVICYQRNRWVTIERKKSWFSGGFRVNRDRPKDLADYDGYLIFYSIGGGHLFQRIEELEREGFDLGKVFGVASRKIPIPAQSAVGVTLLLLLDARNQPIPYKQRTGNDRKDPSKIIGLSTIGIIAGAVVGTLAIAAVAYRYFWKPDLQTAEHAFELITEQKKCEEARYKLFNFEGYPLNFKDIEAEEKRNRKQNAEE